MAILPVNGKDSIGVTVEIDDEDFDICIKHTWWVSNRDKRPYTVIDKKTILLHKFIMNNHDDLIVIDHKDRNIYNNKKDNLRIATHAQNAWNRSPHKDCKNKYKGVYPTYGNKWIADIMVNGKRESIGRFKSEEIAAKARDKKAIEYHGQFAYLNFPDFDYSDWEIPQDDRFKQKSKQRGVSYNTANAMWVVRVQINNKRHAIGNYKNEEEAIAAYNKAKNEGINSVPKPIKQNSTKFNDKNPHKGVYQQENGRYLATIRKNKKTCEVGYFNTKEEAIEARKKAEHECCRQT